MSINQRQFEQLSEMGISLWQHRNKVAPSADDNKTQYSYQTICLDDLKKNRVFNDILLSFNLSIGEIKPEEDHLNLGLINWYFINGSEAPILLSNNCLKTPSLDKITHSSLLKKQLWQTINQSSQ